MATLSDKLWVWGHPTNAFENKWSITEKSYMSPGEGIKWLGGKNVFYIPTSYVIDPDEQVGLLKDMKTVGWSLIPENLDMVIELGKKYPNMKIAICDDFFNVENENNYLLYPPSRIREIADKLHENGLELWMVVYSKHFRDDMRPPVDMREYFKEFDGATFWFWNESEVEFYEERLNDFFAHTEGIRKMIGCYLYNFGDEIPSTVEPTIYQLEKALEYMKQGKLEGLIMHTNCVLDIGHKVPVIAKEWLAEHLDDELPE